MLESLTDVTFAFFLLTGAPECQFHLQIWMKPADGDNINRNGNFGKVEITSRVSYFFNAWYLSGRRIYQTAWGKQFSSSFLSCWFFQKLRRVKTNQVCFLFLFIPVLVSFHSTTQSMEWCSWFSTQQRNVILHSACLSRTVDGALLQHQTAERSPRILGAWTILQTLLAGVLQLLKKRKRS